jgi:hypothetical protein
MSTCFLPWVCQCCVCHNVSRATLNIAWSRLVAMYPPRHLILIPMRNWGCTDVDHVAASFGTTRVGPRGGESMWQAMGPQLGEAGLSSARGGTKPRCLGQAGPGPFSRVLTCLFDLRIGLGVVRGTPTPYHHSGPRAHCRRWRLLQMGPKAYHKTLECQATVSA